MRGFFLFRRSLVRHDKSILMTGLAFMITNVKEMLYMGLAFMTTNGICRGLGRSRFRPKDGNGGYVEWRGKDLRMVRAA